MSKLVELSAEELIERLWVLDVVLIAKKILERGIFNGFNSESIKNLEEIVEYEVKKVIDYYIEDGFDTLKSDVFIQEKINFMYDGIYLNEKLGVEDIFCYIDEIKQDYGPNYGFDKIGMVYFKSDKSLGEDFFEVDNIIENFYCEDSPEYKILNGSESCNQELFYDYTKRYYSYSIKDKAILKYLEVNQGDREKELIVKYYIQCMLRGLDRKYFVIGWKLGEGEIEVLLEVDNRDDEYLLEDIIKIKTEVIVKSMVMRSKIVEELSERLKVY